MKWITAIVMLAGVGVPWLAAAQAYPTKPIRVVTALPRNSVGGTQRKKDAVTGSKVKNGSLLART